VKKPEAPGIMLKASGDARSHANSGILIRAAAAHQAAQAFSRVGIAFGREKTVQG
jgi:hypothetical protein